ncbi:MAG: YARHG domain-containing protein, partial [Akkermansiaceae bacterium]
PYARRGYVFKNKDLKAYFEAQPWYMPDPEYKEAAFTEEEKAWLKEVRALEVAK